MAFDNLKWWVCDYCGSPLFNKSYDSLIEISELTFKSIQHYS
jgi:hypothetical protein